MKTANEYFEEWYPEFKKETEEKWGELTTEMMLKHVANMSYVEGYFKAIKEEVKK
jgi:hypothetical protein